MSRIKPISLAVLASASVFVSIGHAEAIVTTQPNSNGATTTVVQPGSSPTGVTTATQPTDTGGTSTTVDTSNNSGTSTTVQSQPNAAGGTSTTINTEPNN